jgi:acetoin utilization deacetylase AcuC-like enzyme
MIPIFYRPEQSSTATNSFSPSAGKPRLVIEDWMGHPEIVQAIRLESFPSADDAVLSTAHSRKYIRDIFSGAAMNGFGNRNREIANSLRYTVGSIVAASTHVLRTAGSTDSRVAVSPTSGFHHAGYDFGGGFCTFNGLMIAAIHVQSLGLAKRILILDMDNHYGNGTDDILNRLGIDYVDHITASTSYRTAAEALQSANLSNNERVRNKSYDLVLYQAGADIHVDDPLGGLLTTDQMIQRDESVFLGCATYGIPLVWNLAGGYQKDADGGIGRVLTLHRNTMLQCIRRYV